MLTRILLVAAYPLLVAARLLNAIRGRDPLRLREPAGSSFWIPRGGGLKRTAYYLESSAVEGRGANGSGWLARAVLEFVAARIFGGRRRPGPTPADRDADIPDEVYTLW